ncbi:unnamed protein product [Camellia sinensis]
MKIQCDVCEKAPATVICCVGQVVDQDNAFAEMINGIATEYVSSGFDTKIVVIEGDSLEGKVSYAIAAKDGGEAGFGGGGGVDGCGVMEIQPLLLQKRRQRGSKPSRS